MLNPNNKNTAFLITVFGLIYILSFVVSTEFLTDNSVMSQSPTLAWGLLIAVIPSVIFILMSLKYSTIMSLISLGLIAGISFILFIYRNTLGFYAIEEDLAKKFINDKNLSNFEDITKISGDWIKDQTVTVLFYGKKEFNYDVSDEALLNVDKLNEVKDKFIKKVNEESSMREDSSKPLIVSEDFSSVDIKNKGDQKLFAKMLNSIYYTKFAKNLILVLKVDDHKNLTSSGFDRSIIEKSVVTNSDSKDSDKTNPPTDEDKSKNTKPNSKEGDNSGSDKENNSENINADNEGGNKSKDADADKGGETNPKDVNGDKENNSENTNADKGGEINPKDDNADKEGEINSKDVNADKEGIQSKEAELNKDVESESRNNENLSKNQEDNGSPVGEQSKEKSDDNAEVLDDANGPQQGKNAPIVISEYTQKDPEGTTNNNQQSQGASTETAKDDQNSKNAAEDGLQSNLAPSAIGEGGSVRVGTPSTDEDNTDTDEASRKSDPVLISEEEGVPDNGVVSDNSASNGFVLLDDPNKDAKFTNDESTRAEGPVVDSSATFNDSKADDAVVNEPTSISKPNVDKPIEANDPASVDNSKTDDSKVGKPKTNGPKNGKPKANKSKVDNSKTNELKVSNLKDNKSKVDNSKTDDPEVSETANDAEEEEI